MAEKPYKIKGYYADDIKRPQANIFLPEPDVILYSLAKAGYDTYSNLERMPCDIVLNMYHYDSYTRAYENAVNHLNKLK